MCCCSRLTVCVVLCCVSGEPVGETTHGDGHHDEGGRHSQSGAAESAREEQQAAEDREGQSERGGCTALRAHCMGFVAYLCHLSCGTLIAGLDSSGNCPIGGYLKKRFVLVLTDFNFCVMLKLTSDVCSII